VALGSRFAPLTLNLEERSTLERWVQDSQVPRALKQRACVILACAEGKTNLVVAREVQLTSLTVGRWRRRFLSAGLRALNHERRGRPIPPLILSFHEQTALKAWARSEELAPSLRRRAPVILACAEGKSNGAVAQETGLTEWSVGNWRRRFLAGLKAPALQHASAPDE
jgi:transposase